MAPDQYTLDVVKQFQQLFDQRRYTEAAELAVNSPHQLLATIQSIPVVAGQSRPLWQLYKKLFSIGKLNASESLELSRLVVNQNKKNLLESWLAEDKLECSEELGDLVKILDNNLAHNIYAKARANPRPVSTSAERGGVEEILLYSNQVNSGRNAPWVVGKLLDAECPEDFIKSLILTVRTLIPVETLVEECEKRNHLHLLTQFLEYLVGEGSQDVHVHNALGKIIIDNNNNPEHFLTINPYYDSRCVGKYCEKKNPNLAVVAYRRGNCVDELINFTNTNRLFKLQAIYVVEMMDSHFWEKVLDPSNEFRRQLIDEVVSMAVSLFKDTLEVSAAIKAFMTADLPHELVKLLEKIVLQTSAFRGNSNLQNLLILTAFKVDTSRVMDYINRLDNYDGRTIGEVAVEAGLYEEAFAAFKKFNLNVQAVNVLLHNIHSIERAVEFAFHIKEDTVWSQTVDNGPALEAYVKAQATSNQVASFTSFTGQTSEPIYENFGKVESYTEKKGMAEVESEISKIIGMNDLKLQLRNWAKVMLLNEKRRALGHNLGARKLPHMAFLGNPGTGKTMVARILGKLLHMVGILPTDRVTEVQRTDLVGEHIGQTGPKTRAKINEAEGGILFVDEAYRLAPPQGKGGYQDFGVEALEEIMSVMDTGKIVVIFAGYEEQMKSVIASNEGFQRRVTKFFNFTNYNPMDLAQIVHVKMTKQAVDSPFYGFKLHPSCSVEAIRKIIERETTEELRNKMNGGLAELMLVNALEKLDLRLDIDTVGSNELVTITMEDLVSGVRSLVK